MKSQQAIEALTALFMSESVVDLAAIRGALGCSSDVTAFRHLRAIDYRRSYNHNGAYYTLHLPGRFDEHGLWHWRDVYFSVDGSLRDTVRRVIYTAPAGATHRELHELLKVRTHNTLMDLLKKGEIEREHLLQFFVYLHIDAQARDAQLEHRQQLIAAQHPVPQQVSGDVSDAVIIEVLLTLIWHPGSTPAEVVRYLRGHVPPIRFEQVNAVFRRFDLGAVGKKTSTVSIS